MKTTANTARRKSTPGKRPAKKKKPQAGRKISEDKSLQEMKTWFEDNRSLHPLALFAKFYERF